MWRKFCGWFLTKVMGWTIDSPIAPEPKAILLGVPHTTIWDLVVSYLFYESCGGNAKVMIKKEAFFWPLGPILRAIGGVPIDRTNATSMVMSIIDEFNSKEVFHLAMCPEGTRKAVKRWKLGFHKIARETGAAVYLSYFDWGTRHIGIGERFELTDDPQADVKEIRKKYRELHLVGFHKDGYTDEL